jgi:hypothetical protein
MSLSLLELFLEGLQTKTEKFILRKLKKPSFKTLTV